MRESDNVSACDRWRWVVTSWQVRARGRATRCMDSVSLFSAGPIVEVSACLTSPLSRATSVVHAGHALGAVLFDCVAWLYAGYGEAQEIVQEWL